MGKHVTSYRIKVPAEKDPGGAHPELLISATNPDEAKREAWDIMRWPDAIGNASELEAIEAYITTSTAKRRRAKR